MCNAEIPKIFIPPDVILDVYIAPVKIFVDYPKHWILILAPVGSKDCLFYHVIENQLESGEKVFRNCYIETELDLDKCLAVTSEILTPYMVGSIPGTRVHDVLAHAELSLSSAVPGSQPWSITFLRILENQLELIQPGMTDRYIQHTEPTAASARVSDLMGKMLDGLRLGESDEVKESDMMEKFDQMGIDRT
ncbi:hypothetical protein BJX99DRAFT_261199 [Aspergillus californicus]